ERLVFDFPPSTSVIVDPRCRAVRGFIGAQWVAQEYFKPVSDINEFFELKISPTDTDIVKYSPSGEQSMLEVNQEDPLVHLYEVFDHRTKSTFFLVEGYKDYVQKPQPVYPETTSFWPLFALTFNDIETEPGARSTIFPPSDVQLVKAAQKEWNRSRNSLRSHRR